MNYFLKEVMYHSHDWEGLVETGWITMFVIDTPGGQVARMLYHPLTNADGRITDNGFLGTRLAQTLIAQH